MKDKDKKDIRILIVMCVLLIVFGCFKSKAQTTSKESFHSVEVTNSFNDKAIGLNYYFIHKGLGVVGGFESGVFRDVDYKFNHYKFRLGFAGHFKIENKETGILYLTASKHVYKKIGFQLSDKIKRKKPFTFEVGAKYCFPDNPFTFGFQYDFMARNAGFSIGIILNRRK